jgi:hypothetical protein
MPPVTHAGFDVAPVHMALAAHGVTLVEHGYLSGTVIELG